MNFMNDIFIFTTLSIAFAFTLFSWVISADNAEGGAALFYGR